MLLSRTLGDEIGDCEHGSWYLGEWMDAGYLPDSSLLCKERHQC